MKAMIRARSDSRVPEKKGPLAMKEMILASSESESEDDDDE